MLPRRQLTRSIPALVGLLALAIPAVATAQVRWGRPATPRAGACFYRDAGFRGDYFCIRAGEELAYIPAGLNDEISSIRTFGSAEVTVFRDRRFSGRSERFPNDVPNLRNEGWNDRLSSLTVRSRRGGRDDRYDGRPGRVPDRDADRGRDDRGRDERAGRRGDVISRAAAEQIVRRAYLSVFRREPDPASRSWVDQVQEHGWSEDELARQLRQSPEYRRRQP